MPIENPMQLGMVAKVILRIKDGELVITTLAYDGQGIDGWVLLDVAKLPRHVATDRPYFFRDVDAFVRLAYDIAHRNDLRVTDEIQPVGCDVERWVRRTLWILDPLLYEEAVEA